MVYPFLPIFGRGMGVDLHMLSMALVLRSVSGVFGPFVASIADSRGRKAGMLLGLAVFTLGVGILALRPSFPTFVVMLILTITGNFIFIPSMQAYLGDRIAYRRRGMALALTEFGWSFSFIFGIPAAGFLIAHYGWYSPFSYLTALGLVAMLVLGFLLPKDRAPSSNRPSLSGNLRRVFSFGPALAGISFAITLSAANELINLIFGVWLEDSFNVQIAALAGASLIIGLSELGGETLVSVLTDKLGKGRSVAIGLALNCLVVLVLPLFARSLYGAMAGLFLFYFTFEFTLVSSIPLMTEVLPEARATFMATFIAGVGLGRALGAWLSPRLYELSISLGSSSSLYYSILITVGLNLLALGILRLVKAKQ